MLFVFMSQPDFACNPHALWNYIKNNTEHETGWIVKRNNRYDELRARGIQCALYDTYAGNELIEKADYVITNSYTFLDVLKREGQIFANLWHGSGIKAHDYYDRNLNPKHADKLKNYFNKIDLLCVHSLDDRFKLSAQLHFDMRNCFVTGQPRLDGVKTSDGKGKLKKIFGDTIEKFSKFIFFAPSFRANMSTHSGKFYSDNVFRLDDYKDKEFESFLERDNIALIYKLHPIEQTAFSGRNFALNKNCFELTDDMLFEADIRYTELLNAFDVMVSDYSSIVFDYLLLDRPVIYLIPDYNEYLSDKGFVFHNIDYFMPGDKAFNFCDLIKSLEKAISNPNVYAEKRKYVIDQRFDYIDDQSSKRCLETILSYTPLQNAEKETKVSYGTKMPSVAEHVREIFKDENILIIDSTSEKIDIEAVNKALLEKTKIFYVTSEIPNEYRRIGGKNSYKIADLKYYFQIKENPAIEVAFIEGGVDYKKFANVAVRETSEKTRIGFAGTIDNRIYFAMVQFLCEAFPECEIIFAGHIYGNYPVWLNGYANLKYVEASYDELPRIINSFDVAILPFFGGHRKLVPNELFQYLAVGKCVVTSDMENLPSCRAIYRSKSVDEAVNNVKEALARKDDPSIKEEANALARQYDWSNVAKKIANSHYKI